MNAFQDLGCLGPPLLQGLDALGYATMTPIQAAALPPILAGSDVIAQARTGSGKTAAFGLGLLSRLDPALIRVQGLVLCPTRELADQVSNELRRLARFVPNIKVLTLCGGIPLRPQLASLQHDPHLVVGSPGRIQELLAKGALKLDALQVLVLDEADRMLDMGFLDAMAEVIAHTPATRQTLLFSATYPDEIRAVSRQVQREPVTVTVASGEGEVEIEQRFVEVDAASKRDALASLLSEQRPESALVFCNTKHATKQLADDLRQLGHAVLALHGDLDQREREEVLVRFANRSCAVLVATDVAARGLDIKELPVVFSFELATDADVHVHRVGRTGRAGQSGLAIALCAPGEAGRVGALEARQGFTARWTKWSPAGGKRGEPLSAPMVTLCIDGGRTEKVRPGDVLGALTGEAGIEAAAVGKIDLFATRCYVAIRRDQAGVALTRLGKGKIKGRTFRVRRLA